MMSGVTSGALSARTTRLVQSGTAISAVHHKNTHSVIPVAWKVPEVIQRKIGNQEIVKTLYGLTRRVVACVSLSCALTFLATASVNADTGTLSTKINIESVNNYSPCGSTNLPNSNADAAGFLAGMRPVGTIYTVGVGWSDANVWSTDFQDPNTNSSLDRDYLNFDKPNSAISYFAGHGNVNNGNTTVACTTASTCTNPSNGGSGAVMPSFCLRRPGDNSGRCAYTKYNRALISGSCTSGTTGTGNTVFYSAGKCAWGESAYSGTWAGASTNGGTNLVVLHSSDAELSNRGQEIWPAFAGVHMIATTLVHTGDTANISQRGANFAARYRANPNGSVAQAWNDALNANPTSGTKCKSLAGTVFGGGFGFNGCGAQNATTLANSSANAGFRLGDSWYDLQFNTVDATGNGFWAAQWTCNYDCNTWSFYI